MNFNSQYWPHAHALYHALKQDAFYIALEKSVDKGRSPQNAMIRYMAFSMAEADQTGDLFIPKGHEYGASVWARTLPPKTQEKKHHAKTHFLAYEMGKKSLETYHAIVGFMSEKAKSFVDDRFYYLSILGILPRFQGRGLGEGLVRPVLEKTDALGIPTYLETFVKKNMTFYRRLGYREAASFFEPVTRAEYWIMIRKEKSMF